MSNEETKPWERQKDPETGKLEPIKSYKYLTEYILMGDTRSLAKLCKKLGKNKGYVRYLEKYSADYNWQERVQAHEEFKIKQRKEDDFEENSKIWYKLKDMLAPDLLESIQEDIELSKEIMNSDAQPHLKANGRSALSKSIRNKSNMILRLIDEPETISDRVKADINIDDDVGTGFIVQMDDKELEELLTINDDYEDFTDQL